MKITILFDEVESPLHENLNHLRLVFDGVDPKRFLISTHREPVVMPSDKPWIERVPGPISELSLLVTGKFDKHPVWEDRRES